MPFLGDLLNRSNFKLLGVSFACHCWPPIALHCNQLECLLNWVRIIMTQIRQKYLQDTTVTIVLVGSCAHSRRYVDWELKSSLRQGQYTPNGVMGIILPSQGDSCDLPQRLANNWSQGHANCYARYWVYPSSGQELREWIEDAYSARTSRAHLINNSQDMMKYNARCNLHQVTH